MNTKTKLRPVIIALIAVTCLGAQDKLPPQAQRTFSDPSTFIPELSEASASSELRDVVTRYAADRQLLQRFYTVSGSERRSAALSAFYDGWLRALPKIDFDRLSQEGRVDYVLLRNRIESDLRLIDRDKRLMSEVAPLVPFSRAVAELQEARQRLDFIKPDAAVSALEAIAESLEAARAAVAAGTLKSAASTAIKASRHLDGLQSVLNEWFNFYNGYDPEFTAKVPAVFKPLAEAFSSYSAILREKLGGLPPGVRIGRIGGGARGAGGERVERPPDDLNRPLVLGEPIIGDPAGREMLLWELGFHATPEDRIGALFWRMHRAARIVFTMNYQMGRWTPRQCVDFLVSNGHEPYTAEGEVRGHIQNSPPLYQASYLLGALQFHSLYRDLVVDKKAMTAKQFHDAFLRSGPMPMEMVRALFAGLPLTRDYRAQWKFYGEVEAAK